MALWQYKFLLIPRSEVVDELNAPLMAPLDSVGSYNWWLREKPKPEFFKCLYHGLPKRKSWDKNQRAWGESGGNELEIWMDGDFVTSVRISIDLANPFIDFINLIASEARRLKGILLNIDGELIEADPDVILECVRSSKNAQFIKNPNSYLINLPKKGDEHPKK